MLIYNYSMNTKRITYLDFAKGIGILFVVLGHIEYISEGLRGFIASFHMPLFFIISGMLIAHKSEEKNDFKSTIVKKSKGILIPYFWFSLLYFFIDIMNVVLNKIDMKTFTQNAISSVTFYGVSVLWFLPCLFIGEFVALLILKNNNKIYFALPLSIVVAVISYLIQIKISSIYESNIDSIFIASLINFIRVFLRGFIASSIVTIGYYIKNLFIKYVDEKNAFCFITGLIFLVITIILSKVNGCIDFHYIILKNVPVFYICAIIGSLSIILLSIGFDYFGKNIIASKIKFIKKSPFSFIEFFGKNSLIIMAVHVHCYILYAGILIAWEIDRYVTRAKSYVFLFNIMLFTMLLCSVVVIIINKFFPFVLGKSNKNK